jgi:undecaprenyl-diphosphatase
MNLFELNEEIFLLINHQMANRFLDFLVVWVFIPLFSLLVLIPLFFFCSKSKEKKILALFSLFSGFFLYWLGHSILKPFFHLARPFHFLEGVRVIGPWHASPYSFPSSTTMLAFGLALPFFFHHKKLGLFLLVLAFLVGFSVIYTGFHTPFDVLGGILFSFLIVFILNKIYENFGDRPGRE